jgi:predicted acylesterase/phospholipase RssA
VGVSAGALVAASLVNGLTTSQMTRALVAREPGVRAFTHRTFFTPAYREWARRGAMLPGLAADVFLQLSRVTTDDLAVLPAMARFARALPLGIFDNEPLRQWMADTLDHPGRTDDFRQLDHPLYVVAADLESGRPIRFGEPGLDHLPISKAVQASTALPGLYPPVVVEGRHCVDGVLLRTVHASTALEHGVDLLLAVNPLVPVDLDHGVKRGRVPRGLLAGRGLPAVLAQTFRTLIHSRLEIGMRRYDTRYPDADVLLFEPDREEYEAFFSNIFSLASRRHVAELAWGGTRRRLRRDARALGPTLRRHGLRLREGRLADDTRTIWRSVGLGEMRRQESVIGRLEAALEALEAELETTAGR